MNTINYKLLLNCFEKSEFNYNKLAEEIQISRNTIRNIMFGHTTPSHYVATKLAEALKLTHDEIVTIFFPNIKSDDEECIYDEHTY
ncbi:hypothetical protein GCM10008932_05740 [Alkalibacterium iburiense]|uniref:HTH cro/C1-type domain-containing protein n=1 Tax=Alkalibacterium iburiense TaxID=290589 RepID=A0ABN0X6A9_9LACT